MAIEGTQATLDALRKIAGRLNEISDRVTDEIRTLEYDLRDAEVFLDAEVIISDGVSLAYGRCGDGWKFVVREYARHGDGWTFTGERPVLSGSRDVRIRAVRQLPELLQKIHDTALRLIADAEQGSTTHDRTRPDMTRPDCT